MSINDWRLYNSKTESTTAAAEDILDEEVVEEVEEVVEEDDVPTASSKKQEIYDYLRHVGYTEEELDGLTKAELVEFL